MESDAMEIENSRADRANTEIDHFERLLVVCRGRTTPYLVYVTKSKLWSPLGGGVPPGGRVVDPYGKRRDGNREFARGSGEYGNRSF
jgi:hypothetical protein